MAGLQRMRALKVLLLVVGLLSAGLPFAARAAADDAGSGGTFGDEFSASGSILDGGAQAVAEHTSTAPDSAAPRRSGGTVTCTYYDDGTGQVFNPGAVDGSHDYRDGIQIARLCVDTATGDQVSFEDGLIWQPSRGPLQMDPRALAQLQVARLDPPAPGIGTNPDQNADQVVRVPTWLWVDAGWAPLSVTANAGGVTATVAAAPSRVVWDMGDGQSVTCLGPGTPYDRSMPASQQATDCSYTYTHTSAGQPGGRFTVTATVYWTVTFTSNVTPGGQLGEISQSQSFPLRVTQAQALND